MCWEVADCIFIYFFLISHNCAVLSFLAMSFAVCGEPSMGVSTELPFAFEQKPEGSVLTLTVVENCS